MVDPNSVLIVKIKPTELESVVIDDDLAGNPNEDVGKGENINPKDLKKEVDTITLIPATNDNKPTHNQVILQEIMADPRRRARDDTDKATTSLYYYY